MNLLKKTAADGVWPARPFDPKCRSTVPVDDDIVEQIRAIIVDWDPNDWSAVRAVLEVEVPNVSLRVSKLTVRDVQLLFNAIDYRSKNVAKILKVILKMLSGICEIVPGELLDA